MSAPSAHPNCCARHPSLSSPICVSPEPTLIHFPNTVTFSPKRKFTRVETWSSGENVATMFGDTYSTLNLHWVISLGQIFFLQSLATSLSLSTMAASLCYSVADLASGISVLWPSLCISVGYLAEPPLTYMHSFYSGAFISCLLHDKLCIRLCMCHGQMYFTDSSIRANSLFAGICRIYCTLLHSQMFYASLTHFIFNFQYA